MDNWTQERPFRFPKWFVYIVRCADDSLYTGIARDVKRRVEEHNCSDKLGARYTRQRRPVSLAYLETFDSRSGAACREYEIKSLGRPEKERLIERYKAVP